MTIALLGLGALADALASVSDPAAAQFSAVVGVNAIERINAARAINAPGSTLVIYDSPASQTTVPTSAVARLRAATEALGVRVVVVSAAEFPPGDALSATGPIDQLMAAVGTPGLLPGYTMAVGDGGELVLSEPVYVEPAPLVVDVPMFDPQDLSEAELDALFDNMDAPALAAPPAAAPTAPHLPAVQPARPIQATMPPPSAPQPIQPRPSAPQPIQPTQPAKAPLAPPMPPATTQPTQAPQATPPASTPSGDGDLLLVSAVKGGVGKTSITLTIAELCARAGLTAVAIDGSRGQANLRTLAGIAKSDQSVPGIPDLAKGRIGIDELIARTRRAVAAAGVASCDFVFGPRTAQEATLTEAPTSAYLAAIEGAARTHDLVVVDTQIMERGFDPTGVHADITLPLLASGRARLIMVTDTGVAALQDTVAMCVRFAKSGVPADRVMVIVNRAQAPTPEAVYELERLRSRANVIAEVSGSIATDAQRPWNNPELARAIRSTLRVVTGSPAFDSEPASSTGGGLKGLLRRRGR